MNRFLGSAAIFWWLGVFAAPLFADVNREGPEIGGLPPPLLLAKTIQGPPLSELSWDRLKGRVVVLEFWATWCGPCLKAIPHLNDLEREFKDKPVLFISVTMENEDAVRLFLKKTPMNACVALDDYEVLNNSFHVTGIPKAFIVDANGRIAAIATPARITPENLDEILAGKKCSLPEPKSGTPPDLSPEVVSNQAPALFEISIREHKMAEVRGPIEMYEADPSRCNITDRIAPMEGAVEDIFGKNSSRTIINGKMPEGFYDFELRVPLGQSNELLAAFSHGLRAAFGLNVRRFTVITNVYLLTQVNTNVPGLRPVESPGGGGTGIGSFRYHGIDMKSIADNLESTLRMPVLIESGSKSLYDVDMKWKLSPSEQLLAGTDRRVWKAVHANPDGDWISTLPVELKTGEALENVVRLKAELAKPKSEQFQPNPEFIIAAARERLGLQLTLVQRPVEFLEVCVAQK